MILMRAGPHGPGPPAAVLRQRGLEELATYEAHLREGHLGEAEPAGRLALSLLVDAFLTDRRGQVELFRAAHAVGLHLNRTFGCDYSYDPDEDEYELMCPVFALHRLVAHSVEMTTVTTCSICSAGPFDCLHVPDEVYDGERCSSNIESILPMGGVAFTADPDFLYTWHQPRNYASDDLLKAGEIEAVGEAIACDHCQLCAGAPTEGDLDPVKRYRAMRAADLSASDEGAPLVGDSPQADVS
jgi:hypothetical protein